MFTETLTLPEPWPDVGDVDSQLPPLVVLTVMIQFPGGEPFGALVTIVDCVCGFAPPCCAWKVSDDGVNNTEAWPAAAIHNKTTKDPMTIPARRLSMFPCPS